MKVQPYLFFDGRCEEALEFYKNKLGADVTFSMRFKESPDKEACNQMPPNTADKIMHAAFKIGDTLIMASDGMSAGRPEFKGVSLSITADSESGADKMFNALADGGQVQMPLGKTFFAKKFGMVADKFGVSWMIIAE